MRLTQVGKWPVLDQAEIDRILTNGALRG